MDPANTDTACLRGDLVQVIEEAVGHYPKRRAALLPALHLVQERFGYVSEAAMKAVGDLLGIPPADVLGTLSFYTMFRRRPEGRFHVNVCRNLSCHLNGAPDIRRHLEERLGVPVGGTTEDGLFTLGEVECLGACTEAPVMEIDGEYHFRLTPEKVDRILEAYRGRAQAPAPGEED